MDTNKVLLKEVIVANTRRNVPCILAIMHTNLVGDCIDLCALMIFRFRNSEYFQPKSECYNVNTGHRDDLHRPIVILCLPQKCL
jgi:hypothetical protein